MLGLGGSPFPSNDMVSSIILVVYILILMEVHVEAECGVNVECLILSFNYKSYNAKVYTQY